ncbi:MAG: shikimate kinase [Flavobacterium sp. BFFFF2]|nr:MAG: shikimate kinase [Flavobacterium sp. BFFFF2]
MFNNKKHVVLVGYMAAGKSEVGKKLAEITHLPFVDLDEHIEKQTGLSPAEWIVNRGDIAFRRVEHTLFTELCQGLVPTIISTGGGTPCYAQNDLWLQHPHCISFYLKAAPATLLGRLQKSASIRPLKPSAHTDEEALEHLAKHLFERVPYYTKAKHTIATDGKNIDAVVAELVKILETDQ